MTQQQQRQQQQQQQQLGEDERTASKAGGSQEPSMPPGATRVHLPRQMLRASWQAHGSDSSSPGEGPADGNDGGSNKGKEEVSLLAMTSPLSASKAGPKPSAIASATVASPATVPTTVAPSAVAPSAVASGKQSLPRRRGGRHGNIWDAAPLPNGQSSPGDIRDRSAVAMSKSKMDDDARDDDGIIVLASPPLDAATSPDDDVRAQGSLFAHGQEVIINSKDKSHTNSDIGSAASIKDMSTRQDNTANSKDSGSRKLGMGIGPPGPVLPFKFQVSPTSPPSRIVISPPRARLRAEALCSSPSRVVGPPGQGLRVVVPPGQVVQVGHRAQAWFPLLPGLLPRVRLILDSGPARTPAVASTATVALPTYAAMSATKGAAAAPAPVYGKDRPRTLAGLEEHHLQPFGDQGFTSSITSQGHRVSICRIGKPSLAGDMAAVTTGPNSVDELVDAGPAAACTWRDLAGGGRDHGGTPPMLASDPGRGSSLRHEGGVGQGASSWAASMGRGGSTGVGRVGGIPVIAIATESFHSSDARQGPPHHPLGQVAHNTWFKPRRASLGASWQDGGSDSRPEAGPSGGYSGEPPASGKQAGSLPSLASVPERSGHSRPSSAGSVREDAAGPWRSLARWSGERIPLSRRPPAGTPGRHRPRHTTNGRNRGRVWNLGVGTSPVWQCPRRGLAGPRVVVR
eukprot:jgi/Mesvir1/29285/Mv01552-RA.1